MAKLLIEISCEGAASPGMSFAPTIRMYERRETYYLSQWRGDYRKRNVIRRTDPAWLALGHFLIRQDEAWGLNEDDGLWNLDSTGIEPWQAAVLAACWLNDGSGAVLLQVPSIWLAEYGTKLVASHDAEAAVELCSFGWRLSDLKAGRRLPQLLELAADSLGLEDREPGLERTVDTLEERADEFDETWAPALEIVLEGVPPSRSRRAIEQLREQYLGAGRLQQSGALRVGTVSVDAGRVQELIEAMPPDAGS